MWLDILGIKDTKKSYHICNRHFRPGFIINKKLSRYAYPELYLGHVDPLEESADDAYPSSHLCHYEPLQESIDDLVSCASGTNVDDQMKCNKCKVREARCSEIEAEIKSIQLKIKHLEEKLHLHQQKRTNANMEQMEQEKEEEYVWLIIN